jgi:hypothetical protein
MMPAHSVAIGPAILAANLLALLVAHVAAVHVLVDPLLVVPLLGDRGRIGAVLVVGLGGGGAGAERQGRGDRGDQGEFQGNVLFGVPKSNAPLGRLFKC